MKELKLSIGSIYVKAEWLKDISYYNNNYYKIDSCGDSCCLHSNDIIQEICHEDENYYEYNLGYFENEEFIEVFSWNSDYGEDSIFGNL